jgi:hypothetical protein
MLEVEMRKETIMKISNEAIQELIALVGIAHKPDFSISSLENLKDLECHLGSFFNLTGLSKADVYEYLKILLAIGEIHKLHNMKLQHLSLAEKYILFG